MTILIIEDEKLSADRIISLLHQYDPSVEIAGRLDSVKRSVEWLEKNTHPDLILMDIQLADGISFDIFDKIEIYAPIIFTTAYNEYALKAFKVNSIDYILKPISLKELSSALDKYKLMTGGFHKLDKEVLQTTRQILNKEYKSRFVVKIGEHIQTVSTPDIACFFSMDKATFICNKEKRKFPIEYSLDQLEQLLDPKIFFRISRKHLINLHFVKDIITYSNSRLKIIINEYQEDEMIVSRERVAEFKEWLDS